MLNMQTVGFSIALTGVLATGGCAEQLSTPAPQHAAPRPSMTMPAAPQPTNVKFGFEFAGPNTYLYPMATGVIAFRSNDARSKAFCEAIMRNMLPVGLIEAQSSVAQNIIRTRFLVRSEVAPTIDRLNSTESCQYIMSAYDIDAATSLLGQVNAPNGIGPFMVGLAPNSNNAIIVDASASAVPEFDGIASKWEQAVTQTGQDAGSGNSRENNGSVWKPIFDLFTEALNYFFPAAGATAKVVITVIQGAVCP